MSDLNGSEDFGDVSGFYPRRREGLGNFFIGMLTGIATVIGIELLIIGIGGPGALPLPFLASKVPTPTATLDATLTFTPSIFNSPTPETPTLTPTPSCPSAYVVQAGETLQGIADKCGVSVEAIVAMNPTIDPNNIQIGQTVLLPPAGTGFTPTAIPPDTKPGTVITIRVMEGDTLESIANKCLSTVEDIKKQNPDLEDPNFLFVGMELKCRYGIATPVPTRVSPTYGYTPTYTVTPTP
ncbi:MAG: LysM peptidoglycan-binding domain-containing protein [Anaerolineales bacterium]|nr:LysM peptidoglycan-binding domain-containing protein [Anaerolineales bacterium]